MKISQKRKSERQELLREEQKREQRRSYHQVNERLSHDVNVFSLVAQMKEGVERPVKVQTMGSNIQLNMQMDLSSQKEKIEKGYFKFKKFQVV